MDRKRIQEFFLNYFNFYFAFFVKRDARGKSLSSLLPLETSRLDSSEKQLSRKIRGRSMDSSSMELNSSDRRELTKDVIER